jgi:predicted nucleotidyltransferase component of viral defense system
MNQTEALLVEVMDVIAERFDQHAVLRGGMVLRVLGCERMTNAVDYVFVPFASKKDVVDDLLTALHDVEGAAVTHTLNSKCLRIVLTRKEVAVQIEVKTALDIPRSVVSNRELARLYGWPPRLVSVVDYPVALADKMAAWNERRLVRDVYDIWFYLRMGVRPDEATLKKRLAKPDYSRLVRKVDHFNGKTVSDFYAFLREAVIGLNDDDIEAELSDYLPPAEWAGLAMHFRAELAKL